MDEIVMATAVPSALLDWPYVLASEAYVIARRRITWRARFAELSSPDTFVSPDRLAIVQFMAALETRRIETGSLD